MHTVIPINTRGNITIPASLRRKFGIDENTQLIAEETEEGILLRPAFTMPIEVYSDKRLKEFAEMEKSLSKYFD